MSEDAAVYIAKLEDITLCPACRSLNIATFEKPHYSVCLECRVAWEPIPAGEPFKVDGELLPFETPCDNCAFRGKSTERANEEYWESLQISLAHGGKFFCHKGVPFKLSLDAKSFDYPTTATGGYDQERMRLCRGYLNAFVGPMLQRYAMRVRREP